MNPRTRVVRPAWCAPYVGLPFMDLGRSREGLDCWGLVKLVLLERYGIEVPDYAGYTSTTDIPSVAKCFYDGAAEEQWIRVDKGQEREGDVILLTSDGVPTHSGVVVHPGSMLHILDGTGSVIDGYTRPAWARLVEGFYRHRSVG